jgi:hypothetical protein
VLYPLGFRIPGFWDMRRQKVSHLGFPGAETLKPTYLYIYIYHSVYFGSSQLRFSGYAMIGELIVGYPGCRNTETPYFVRTIIISGFHTSGFRDWWVQENLPIGISGTKILKTPNIIHAKPFQHFSFRDFTLCENKGSRS